MKRLSLIAGLTALALLTPLTVVAARALMIAPSPPSQRVMQADAIIAGKVQMIEKEPVLVPIAPNSPDKQAYTIANVKISEALLGAKGVTHIRVAYPKIAEPQPVVPGRPILSSSRGRFQISLAENQAGVFFLQKHATEDFFLLASNAPPLDVNEKTQIEEVRKTIQVLAEPMKSLKAADAKDRTFAACLLISRYAMPRAGESKQVAIPAEESKLILTALLEGDWSQQPTRFGQLSPQGIFYQLQPQKYGYAQPTAQPGQPINPIEFQKRIVESQRSFIRDNIDKIQIQRFTR